MAFRDVHDTFAGAHNCIELRGMSVIMFDGAVEALHFEVKGGRFVRNGKFHIILRTL